MEKDFPIGMIKENILEDMLFELIEMFIGKDEKN